MLKHCLHNNVHKKQLSWPRLTLHRPPVQNIIGHIRWWLETVFITNNFAFFWYYHRFSTGVIDFIGIHYSDAVMSMMACQITNHAVVYSTVYSGADQRKHQTRVTGLCEGNSPVTGEFPAQRASNPENVFISLRHHDFSDAYQIFPTEIIVLGAVRTLQYIPRNMHTVFALLCFVVVIHWLIFPYPSGLLHWHRGNLTIAPVPAKQPWWIWINTSCEFIMNDCITTTKQSTTKPCVYFLGYTVLATYEDYLTSWVYIFMNLVQCLEVLVKVEFNSIMWNLVSWLTILLPARVSAKCIRWLVKMKENYKVLVNMNETYE